MDAQSSQAKELAAEAARRIAAVAASRERLVVFIEQHGGSQRASETRAALEKLLGGNPRVTLARLANGVSVPETPPSGRGYSEAIGMRMPTPSPDLTVQLNVEGDQFVVLGVLHTGPNRIEKLFGLDTGA
jgi:hypothetical protein